MGGVNGRRQPQAPPVTPHRNHAMTTTEKVAALWAIYEQLDELLTPDELVTYPALQHLGDLIEDLQIDIEREAEQ